MQIAARQSFLTGRAGPTPWTNPYVTDGLVAMWDGEWNAGGGVHDPDATTWADLSGNGYGMTSQGSADWRTNGAAVNSKANAFWRGNCSWFREAWSSSAGVCVESVATLGRGIVFGFGGQNQTWQSFDIDIATLNASIKRFAFRGATSANTPVADGSIAIIRSWANATNYEATMAGVTVSGAYSYQNHSGNGFAVGFRGDLYGTSTRLVNGVIHCVRVYSRALTAAEVAANYAIDAARFGL